MRTMIVSEQQFREEWLSVTGWLRQHVRNLNIPLVPDKNDNGHVITDKAVALYAAIGDHYKQTTNPVSLFCKEANLNISTGQGKIKGEIGWYRDEIERACEILGIPEENWRSYFTETTKTKRPARAKEAV